MSKAPIPPTPVRCRVCGGVDVRRSYPSGVWDSIMLSLGRPPLRCRGCTYRFYHRLRPGERLGRPDVSVEKPPVA